MAYYFGDALTELKKIKGKDDGHLDFSTLPAFAKVEREVIIKPAVEAKEAIVAVKGKKATETEEAVVAVVAQPAVKAKPAVTEKQQERDLGAMISMLTVAVQQLDEKLNDLKQKGIT